MQIQVENLYYLLSYAWQHFNDAELGQFDASPAHSAEELFARVLIGAAEQLLRGRLHRGYRDIRDDLRRPKGKLCVARSYARGIAQYGRLECEFDDLTEDVAVNQVLKASLSRAFLLRGIDRPLRGRIHSALSAMHDVSDRTLRGLDFRGLSLHSDARRYRLALHVCELLHRQLLPNEEDGQWQFASFWGDEKEMGLLFESFVREFFRAEQRAFPHVTRRHMEWNATGDSHDLLPSLSTDIVLERDRHQVIFELKCYGTALTPGRFGGQPKLRSGDVAQLYSYLENAHTQEGERLTGVLLYAVDHSCVPPLNLNLVGHEVLVRELNLNQPWREISLDLQSIVSELSKN